MSIKINNRTIAGNTLSFASSLTYSAKVTYNINDIVKDPSSTILYYSVINGNLNNPLTDETSWKELKLGGSGLEPVVTDILPDVGDATKIYFVPTSKQTEQDSYDEYIWVQANQRFELVGSTRVDLSGYSTTEQMNQAISEAVSVKANTDDVDAKLALKADIIRLTHIPTGLLHSYYERYENYSLIKYLKVSPGYVLNEAGTELFVTTNEILTRMVSVQECISNRTILGTTTTREDLIDYDNYFEGTTPTGTIIPVEALGNFQDGWTSQGTCNNQGTGYRLARDFFGEGTQNSKSGGFVFDKTQVAGNYVVSVASDNIIETAKIGFYRLITKNQLENGTYDFEFELVSQQTVAATNPSKALSFSTRCNIPFDMMAVDCGVEYTRYCRMYYVNTANTYGTFLVKNNNSYFIKLALEPQALVEANLNNFARIGTVTISDGPVWFYPTEDIGTSFANGDFAPQEVDYSNFYSRKEMDILLYQKANRATTLAGYGINDAYTARTIDNKLSTKQNLLTAGDNIKIEGNVVSTTFHELYGKDEVDTLLANKANWGTTLIDYNISDAYTKVETTDFLNLKQNSNDDALLTENKTVVGSINELLNISNGKANLATTLAGYGITDAYTIEQVNQKIAEVAEAGATNVDTVTIITNPTNKTLSTIGVKTKSDIIKYDWVGTDSEWKQGRTDGTIDDEWWCHITDDSVPYVEDANSKTYATVDYVLDTVGQVETTLRTELQTYSTEANTRLSNLESTDARFETRIAALETAMSERIDNINGEVIE